MPNQSIQEIADQLADALTKASAAKEKYETAQEALEKSVAFQSAQKSQKAVEQAESAVDALKELLLVRMKEDGEKNIASGSFHIHTAEKVNVGLSDEKKLFAWLKKQNVYDDYVSIVPSIDKRALNKFVLGMSNDRQLPPEEECGVSVIPNVYIVIKHDDAQ